MLSACMYFVCGRDVEWRSLTSFEPVDNWVSCIERSLVTELLVVRHPRHFLRTVSRYRSFVTKAATKREIHGT